MEHIIEYPALRALFIADTQITDTGLNALTSVPLRALDLTNTQITDAGLEQIKKITSLKLLYVSRDQITDSGIQGLEETLPELLIELE
jgi:Leucine-rich repeat (LRR) protein